VLRRAYLPILVLTPLVAAAACTSNTAAAGPAGSGRGGRGGRGAAGLGQPVVTTKASQRDVPVDIAAVGNVEAYTSISVRSQVTGQLQESFFHEGDIVKKGDQLFTIDPRPLESALQQAEANLVRDRALLNQAEAQLTRDAANAEYQQLAAERQSQLVDRGIVSKDAGEQVRAAADAMAGLVKADKAAIESAKGSWRCSSRSLTTPKCSSATPPSARRSTGAPATTP